MAVVWYVTCTWWMFVVLMFTCIQMSDSVSQRNKPSLTPEVTFSVTRHEPKDSSSVENSYIDSWTEKLTLVTRYCSSPGSPGNPIRRIGKSPNKKRRHIGKHSSENKGRHMEKCIQKQNKKYDQLCEAVPAKKNKCKKFKEAMRDSIQKNLRGKNLEKKAFCKNGNVTKYYNLTSHICCGGKVKRLSVKNGTCCGHKVIDAKEYRCCDGTVIVQQGDVFCCGKDSYNRTIQFCLNEKIYQCKDDHVGVPASTSVQGLGNVTFRSSNCGNVSVSGDVPVNTNYSSFEIQKMSSEKETNEKALDKKTANDDSLSNGLIIVISVAGIVGIVILIKVVVYCVQRRNKSKCLLVSRNGAENNVSTLESLPSDKPGDVPHNEQMFHPSEQLLLSVHQPPFSTVKSEKKRNSAGETELMNNGAAQRRNASIDIDRLSNKSMYSYCSEVTLMLHDPAKPQVPLIQALSKNLNTTENNLTANLLKNNATQTLPLKESNKRDCLGKPFQLKNVIISKSQRTVTLDHSEVVMILPKEDLEVNDIEVSGSTHSDIPAIRKKLDLTKNESLVSPVVEYVLQGVARLLGYAVIKIPYCQNFTGLQVWRMISDEGECKVAKRIEVLQKTQDDEKLDTYYVVKPEQRVVYIFTKVFSLYTCTSCGKAEEIGLMAHLYGNMEKLAPNEVKVNLVLYILDTLYKYKDFHWSIAKEEENLRRKLLDSHQINLPAKTSDSDYLRAYINLHEKHKDLWEHVTDVDEPNFPAYKKKIPLSKLVQCGQHSLSVPYKCCWDLENKAETPSMFKCFLYVGFNEDDKEKTMFYVAEPVRDSRMNNDAQSIASLMDNLNLDEEAIRKILTSKLVHREISSTPHTSFMKKEEEDGRVKFGRPDHEGFPAGELSKRFRFQDSPSDDFACRSNHRDKTDLSVEKNKQGTSSKPSRLASASAVSIPSSSEESFSIHVPPNFIDKGESSGKKRRSSDSAVSRQQNIDKSQSSWKIDAKQQVDSLMYDPSN